MIDIAKLIAAGIPPTQARLFAEPLSLALAQFEINTPARIAAFLGQMMVESQNFTHLEENLWYRSPERILAIFPSRVKTLAKAQTLVGNPQALANCVYASRLGNADEASGEGWRYHGRGLVQLTGKDNYMKAEHALNRSYLKDPDLVAQPLDAALTAAWYWDAHKLNQLADVSLIDEITLRINGPAKLHADLRRQRTQEALKAWS